MDEDHLLAAVRYVTLNPVRARLVSHARDWPWSIVRAHLSGEDDALASVEPVLARTDSFATLIESEADDPAFSAFRAAETTGRPQCRLRRGIGAHPRAPSWRCSSNAGIMLLSPYFRYFLVPCSSYFL
jgi:hypothetical protein